MKQTTVNALPRTIGFDLGSKSSVFCVLDEAGDISKEGSVPMSRKRIRQFFADEPQSRVILEASGSSRWTAQIAMEQGHEVVIGNPRKISFITRSETKSDRNDAFKLADLGQVRPRLLSPVRLRSDKSHEGRMHQRVRSQLVAARTALINCVRGCARTSGHALPSSSTPAFVNCCRKNLPDALLRVLAPLLEQLSSLAEQIKRCNKQTEELGEKVFPEAAILRQVAGVGPVLSLAFVCGIDDPTCFKDSRGAGAYFGLAPKSRQSGGSTPQLRISKCGDSDVRRLLVSAATYILGPFGPDCDLRRFGKRLAKPGSQAAKAKARIAVARKLANLLLHLWVTGEVYEPLRNHPTTAAASNETEHIEQVDPPEPARQG